MIESKEMKEKISATGQEYLEKIAQAESLKVLDEIYIKLFGKNGVVDSLPKQFKDLGKDELKVIGPLFNKVKLELENAIDKKRAVVREEGYRGLENDTFDLAGAENFKLPKRKGHQHPLTQFEEQIAQIFGKIGFKQFDGPLIDTDENNFELLNIPAEHPARDLWDTLYLDYPEINPGKLLLRTHTSNSQIRVMKKFGPGVRSMIIGRCFRYENLDARHEHTFEQFELVYVDKNVSMANLQYLSEYLLKAMYGPDIKVRLKPKYYPFVEPGAGIDGQCIFCKGKGCKVCGGIGWLELAGAGMIHPTVLKNAGIDPSKYSGIAWGVGPARMAMLKWDIKDIRSFNSGELSFLKQF